ncbi:MAG: redoxin domain-containing protein [Tenuifilaceae bacterium]|jgi:thiol-disulfide isomerase/thioredoxin|nr:redoxin domain-containing protein [Tenuifilaceae bacterium]
MQRTLIVIVSILFVFSVSAQDYRIEVKVDGLKDSTLQMGYYFGEKTLLADTAPVNSNGVAVFKGDSLLPRGMYFVVLPNSYFELLITDNQQFSVSTTLENVAKDLVFTNSPENTAFTKYRTFLAQKQGVMSKLQKRAQSQKEDGGEVKQNLLDSIALVDNEVKSMWDATIKANPETLLSEIIRTLKPVEFPDFNIPDDAPNADSLRWITSIRYNQEHYFDNVNFSEAGLIRTPFFQDRIDNYFDRVLIPVADTVIPYANSVIERAQANDDMYRFIVTHLFSKYSNSSIMGMDAVFVNIAENYFLSGKTPWITQETKTKIAERVANLKPNLIGEVAPNLKMRDLDGSLHELGKVDAKIMVIYFWDTNCSFCKKTSPALKKLYQKYKSKGFNVFAVYTQGEPDKWEEYIEKNELDWINVWDPMRTTNYHKLYDIYSTPVIYVLDKDKKIIAKRIGIESLERFIEEEIDK